MHAQPSDALPKIMLARYYGANLGSFLSVDPSSEGVSTMRPQTWNRFMYALGNPLKYVDPDGRVVTLVGKAARKAHETGMKHSQAYRDTYNSAHNNPDINITISVGSGQSHGKFKVERMDVGVKDAEGNRVYDENGNVKTEPVWVVTGSATAEVSGEAGTPAKMAHEMKHATEQNENGPTKKNSKEGLEEEREADAVEDDTESQVEEGRARDKQQAARDKRNTRNK